MCKKDFGDFEILEETKAYILAEVRELMKWNMEAFPLEWIIDQSEELTEEEKQWAKDHLGWKIVEKEE